MTQENPDSIIVAIKREMGNRKFSKEYEGRKMTPELLSAMILMKLKQDAEAKIGPIGNAVITVPYYFNEPCRKATLHAGRIAGLNVIDIINEPSAATLAYAWNTGELGRPDLPDKEKRILVYDLGGGTFDVTLVRYTPTHFSVESTDGDTFLGGLDWTQRLVEHVCDRFRGKHGTDPRDDNVSLLQLTKECEDAKQELSLFEKTNVHVNHAGNLMQVSITRQEFEKLTADLLQRTIDTTEFVLDNAKVNPEELQAVLLVGGSTAMPAVSKRLQDLCGITPSRELLPQLAVAQGAAIHAAILQAKATGDAGDVGKAVIKRLESVTATDVNSHSLGVEITDPTLGKRNHIMIPRNSKLPVGVKQRFVTNLENPQSICIRLLEGEAEDVAACTFIGDFRLDKLPESLPVGSPIEVQYSYDVRGHIHVSMTELTTNKSASVEIAWRDILDEQSLDSFQQLVAGYAVE
ncbi:MAG: heat-shock protein Hsp70 [Planctomycetaceae bacterium]|nr:heat-shock protein Hsp70 [Planctomycetaceae bacterium]